MTNIDAIRARLALANAVLCVCASYGRRFFSEDGDRRERKEFPRISRFEIDPRGRLWFIDKWRGARIYVHNEYPWRSGWSRRFSEGGTLLDLCKALRDFIRTGDRRFMRHFGPWPQSCCGGDLWGYGDDMPLVRRDVAALLAALDAKAQKEGGETCSDCPPAGYPTDKTRCDECPRRAQKEDGER